MNRWVLFNILMGVYNAVFPIIDYAKTGHANGSQINAIVSLCCIGVATMTWTNKQESKT